MLTRLFTVAERYTEISKRKGNERWWWGEDSNL